ncbi:aldo/keto reductase [Actinopolymorpha alba]|uniref:aldo/keto reductase n=1 Tax=Actinopolymorpha alba TaxID=533267 RepID=UPI000380E00D|nr:aldo/keto reductase [Actinopolymorpha alba]
MEYTHLGRTGVLVSRLCLGTMNFGPVTPEPEAHAILDAALDAGLNFTDTANVYGWENKGLTEEILGRWFAGDPSRRDRTVLATKVYGAMDDEPGSKGVSARNIIRNCEASLRRLQTDRIDLYQMHHIDRDTPWDEVWQAFETLVGQGKVLYVGSSNFAGWHIAQAQETAVRRNFLGLVSEQSLYNLAERSVELEVLPAARAYGLGVIPWSPLHGGVLGGILAKSDRNRSQGGRASTYVEAHRDTIQAFENLAAELRAEPANLALAWLLHQPGVTAPIIGPRTMDQLTGALAAVDLTLDEKVLERLDELFPGPGGPAPEAYAW